MSQSENLRRMTDDELSQAYRLYAAELKRRVEIKLDYTPPAARGSSGHPVELIDGRELMALVRSIAAEFQRREGRESETPPAARGTCRVCGLPVELIDTDDDICQPCYATTIDLCLGVDVTEPIPANW